MEMKSQSGLSGAGGWRSVRGGTRAHLEFVAALTFVLRYAVKRQGHLVEKGTRK